MKFFLYAYDLPIFDDKMFSMDHKLGRVICRSIFVSAYNVHDVAALTNVKVEFVEDVLFRIGRIWLECPFSQNCIVRFFVGCWFHPVRFTIMTAVRLKRRPVR